MSYPSLTAEQEAIAQRTAELVLARLPAVQPPPEVLTAAQAQELLLCKTTSALYRELQDLGVRAYRAGKYRRHDIINALGRRSHAAQAAAKRQRRAA